MICTLIEKDGKPNWCTTPGHGYHRGHYAAYAVDPGEKGQRFRKYWDERRDEADRKRSDCIYLGSRLTKEEGKRHELELLQLQVKCNTCNGERHEFHCSKHRFTNFAKCRICPDKREDIQVNGTWISDPDVWKNFRAMIDREKKRLEANPLPTGDGNGIVIVGGGKYFASAYCNIRLLRHQGCKLPIELWYLGRDDEMPEKWRKIVEPYNVRCVDADEVRKSHPMRILNGWELKPYAVQHSGFRRVLFLDADCYSMRNPSFVFDEPRFLGTGAVFQRDCSKYEWVKPDLLTMFGVPQQQVWDLESGAFVVDKQRWGLALGLTVFLNSHSDLVYKVVHGDKTTFALGGLLAGQPYAIPKHAPGGGDWGLMQYWFDGFQMWQHRIHCKPSLQTHHYHSNQNNTRPYHWTREIDGWLNELRRLI